MSPHEPFGMPQNFPPSTHPGLAGTKGLGVQAPTILAGVCEFLAAGSPRLALARAYGVPLAPYILNVRAQFPDVNTADVPQVGADVKIVQDTLVDAMVVRVLNQSRTANQNQLQTLSDYFYNFQSGIEATLDVVGAPRYSVAPKFTPLSTLTDVVNGNAHWPNGWVLTYQQQIMMSFRTSITLPFAPIEVVCSFRTYIPTNEMFVSMTNREALDTLALNFGIDVGEAYRDRLLAGR